MASGFSVFVNIGGKVSPSLGAAIRAVDSSFLGLSNRLKNIGASVDKPFRQVEAGLKRHQKRIEKIQEKGVGLSAAVTLPAGVVAKRGFDTMLGFEKEMNKAQAYGELDDGSRNQIEAMARRIEAGQVSVNGIVKTDPRLPSGGIKRSGYGRELGPHGIREFVNAQQVWVGPAQA